ncbi:MAG: leucyl aminopeptidase [Thermomicrobiales bacterium]|nr:leucyl aminopeptidase [Thermomicrobiales bacterium]
MEIVYRTGSAHELAVDALITFSHSWKAGDPLNGGAAAIDAELDGELATLLADNGFTGKGASTFITPTFGKTAARRVIVVGLGDADAITEDGLRLAYGTAVTTARDAGAKSVAASLPNSKFNTIVQVAEAADLATYRFEKYVGAAGTPSTKAIESITITGDATQAEADAAITEGRSVASAVALARDLVNEPGSVINPVTFAELAQQIADEQGFEYEELTPVEMEAAGMGAIQAVGKGSAIPPRLIRLTYRPGHDAGDSRSIGLVGKCITFDTGGYSIKPYEGMLTMKNDMSGGAAVLATMTALKATGCRHTVHGVIAAAENMISGEAFRPGDILTAANGVTIEVLSTDAEGRLVLADALVYTAKQGVEEMIDLATLTGAAVVALGDGSTALFSNNDALADRILAASEQAGEFTWRMPLTPSLEQQIKGDVGDIKNTGGRGGGAITAALFLQHFSEGLPWAHLDIAGSAFSTKANGYNPKGGVGVMVRTLLNYLAAEA